MPTEVQVRLPPTVPSTSLDGLDLTVAEARVMPAELFGRTFGVASLDDVPTVGPGFRDRKPPGCRWYVRFRPAPTDPKPKDRRTDAWELVVKAPVRAQPAAGGGMAGAPKSFGLRAKDADGARLEALVRVARAQGRKLRATTWPIERVEALSCCDLLGRYLAESLGDPPPGRKETRSRRTTRRTYRAAIKCFQRAFPELEVGDCKGRIDLRYAERTGRPPTSCYVDLKTVKRALNAMLDALGVPKSYRIGFDNHDPGRLRKERWSVAEYDRLLAAAAGWRHNPDGTPMMVPGPSGPVQARRRPESRKAWLRAIEFLTYTASRNGQIFLTRWLPPEVDPADGRPLGEDGEGRPWLDVREDCIEFLRDGEVRYDGNKRKGANFIPREFEATVRAWYEEDMTNGVEFVFHKRTGARYGRRLCNWTFGQIVKDAGLGRRKVHHLKDLALQWADCAELRRSLLAAHADTSERMLERTYGPSGQTDLLEAAAEKITQKAWRKKGADRAARVEKFVQARGRARSASGHGANSPADAAAGTAVAPGVEASASAPAAPRPRAAG
ncbi:MAG TPA: hypothetical protein VGO49_07585 [Bradyrhizobium sp.]|jgi:hypothetical protein|nr:hypothetical protein [Bradyrhizobium sp.]